jgi:beta-ureidopropionase / N-carbamoyl-L-amino-acid hydrolase
MVVPGADRAPSAERVEADLAALASLTDPGRPGWTRMALTDVEAEGRQWALRQLRDLGLRARIDAAGNVIGVLEGTSAGAGALMTGSHTDTVDGGGRFDGVVGFVGALEAVRLIRESGRTLRHDLVIADFFGEEPNRFGLSCVGSRALAGRLGPDHLDLTDAAGRRFGTALEQAGIDAGGLSRARLDPGYVRAFIELHVEQGPVLERAGSQLGLVTSITGVTRFRALFTGERGHAGTTAMPDRRDAGCAAAGTVLAVERIASAHEHTRGTTGSVVFTPDAVNVVTGQAELTGELRSPDGEWLSMAREELLAAAQSESDGRGVRLDWEWLPSEPPVPLDSSLLGLCQRATARLGYRSSRLYSAAEHDTAVLAGLAPAAMIFVPSRDGRSHCPEEWTDTGDVLAGVHALTECLLSADESL